MDFVYNIFSLLFLLVICCIPILFWGYFFSFHSDTHTRKRFLYGVFAGWVSTFPILAMEHFYADFLPSLNIFKYLHSLDSFDAYVGLLFSLVFIVVCIAVFFLLVRRVLKWKKVDLVQYVKAIWFYAVWIWILWVLFFIFSLFEHALFWEAHKFLEWGPVFMWYAFQTVKLMILYYCIIAFLEEGTKYFAFLSWVNFSEFQSKQWVTFSLYIALGFAFFENILYSFSLFSEIGLTAWLVSIIFYRSIFSLFVHVFASVILWYYFSKYYTSQWISSIQICKYIFFWVLWAITIHASYDIVVTLGWTFLIFLYFIWGYFYVSKLIFWNT